ncbi:hypothetical protein [Clostridium sp.]|uniref:hypothetical protein n=1 Tax=Clostridium sp. TaxID=1506 RepID=UPI002FC73835
MKYNRKLMTRLSIGAGLFGYLFIDKFSIGFRLLFIGMAFLATILYVKKGIENKNSKVSIVVSILSLILLFVLILDEIFIDKYHEFLGYRGYIMLIGSIIFIVILTISALNYIKIANKKEAIFTKVLLIMILLSIVFVVILIVLKQLGILI